MSGEAAGSVRELFQRWQAEDRELEAYLDALRDWMHQASRLDTSAFEEATARLRRLRMRLERHFRHEDKVADSLETSFDAPPAELAAVRRQSVHDRTLLFQRLDELIAKFDRPAPPFESWEDAIENLELFVDTLEQHEEQEADSIELLMPRDDDPQ